MLNVFALKCLVCKDNTKVQHLILEISKHETHNLTRHAVYIRVNSKYVRAKTTSNAM